MSRSLLTTSALMTIAVVCAPSSAEIFGSDAFSTAIGIIDPNNASWNNLGSAGVVINGMAYNSNTETMYGVSAGNSALYTIDQQTGATRRVGTSTLGYGNINALGYDANHDVLYGTDNNTNALFWIDENGRSNTIATIGGGFTEIEGLAYDSDNDILYGLTQLQSAIVSIDVNTGVATQIASLQSAVWRGLTWDSDSGSLILSAVNIFNDAGIYRYDIGGDSLSFMGNTIGVEAVQGLAYRSVPAPAGLALLGLGGGLAARRRRG